MKPQPVPAKRPMSSVCRSATPSAALQFSEVRSLLRSSMSPEPLVRYSRNITAMDLVAATAPGESASVKGRMIPTLRCAWRRNRQIVMVKGRGRY